MRENQVCINDVDDINDKNCCDKKIETKQNKNTKQNHLTISKHKDYMSPFVPMSPFVKTKCPRWFVPNCISNPSMSINYEISWENKDNDDDDDDDDDQDDYVCYW